MLAPPVDPPPDGATAPAGSVSFMPGVIKLLAVMLLAASSAESETRLRAAIELNESPALTVYVALPDAVVEAVLESVVGATAPAGSASVMPGVIKLDGVIPFAASNAARL